MRDDMSLSDGQAKLTNKSRICVLTDEFSLANARISPQARERIAIREWPIDERLREKLLARGPEALSDAELLAILLRTGIRVRSAVHVARGSMAHAQRHGTRSGRDIGRPATIDRRAAEIRANTKVFVLNARRGLR